MQSNGPVKLIFHLDVTEHKTSLNINFKLTFHVSNKKLNILETPFLKKYVESIECSSDALEMKHKKDINSLKFYNTSAK